MFNKTAMRMSHESDADALIPLVEMPWHRLVEVASANSRITAVLGGPGTGKSTFVEHLAQRITGRRPLVHYASPVDNSNLWGRWVVQGDETRFIDGKIPTALKQNRWLCIEEFSLLPVEERMPLLAREDGRHACDEHSEQRRIGDSAVVADDLGGNRGKYAVPTKCGGDDALLSDAVPVDVPSLDSSTIDRLLRCHFPTSDGAMIERVSSLYQTYRQVESDSESGNQGELNFRAARQLMQLLLDGRLSEREAVRLTLVNQWILDSDQWSAQQLRLNISE